MTRSKEELRKNLGLGMLSKIKVSLYICALTIPAISLASPPVTDIPLPPVSFTFVEDKSILEDIGLDPGPAWCYDVQANALIITAPARERAKCELKLMYELEKQKVKHEFEIDKLKLRIDTLNQQHTEINLIKDREIERLTTAAIRRPNDYTVWWATGGFISGALITLAIVSAAQ